MEISSQLSVFTAPQLPSAFGQLLYGNDCDHVTKCIDVYSAHTIPFWCVHTQSLDYLSKLLSIYHDYCQQFNRVW